MLNGVPAKKINEINSISASLERTRRLSNCGKPGSDKVKPDQSFKTLGWGFRVLLVLLA